MSRTRWTICRAAAALLATGLTLAVATYCAYRLAKSDPLADILQKRARLDQAEKKVRARLQLLVGSAKDAVRAQMGQPTRAWLSTLPSGILFGPQEALTHILKPGQPYEEWAYSQGEVTGLVWFAGAADGVSAPEDWKVVGIGTHVKGSVY